MRKKLSVDWSPDLFEAMTRVSSFNWTFTVTEPSVLKARGHIDCAHRGIAGTQDKAIMVAMQFKLNGTWIAGSKTGCNIVGTEQHYAIMPVHVDIDLTPGTYEVSLYARSASTAAPGVNGLAEIKGTYNEVVYEVESL